MFANKTCPKCGGEMIAKNKLVGWGYKAVAVADSGQTPDNGDKVIPFCCQKCGYIELYNEKNL
jgi:predicted nucleic-acid-binding Zn-ribbon protein